MAPRTLLNMQGAGLHLANIHPTKRATTMENTNFDTLKHQTAERLTVRYDRYISKLKKALSKARRLEKDLRGDYRGYVAIECMDFDQFLSPIQVAQFIVRDIRALIPLIERERDNAERDIMEAGDYNDLEVVEAWVGRQLGNYGWNVRNLNKPLQEFKYGYGSGVEAYIMYRQAWQTRYR